MNASAEAPQTSDDSMSQAVSSQVAPKTRLDRVLADVPKVLSSHAHIIFLGGLGIYLVLLPLVGVSVSSKAELIGGNYTNVTSDLGACIAAGLTVHIVKRERSRSQELEEKFQKLHRRHDALEQAIGRMASAAERAEAAGKGGSRDG
jgi:hypothetical protein